MWPRASGERGVRVANSRGGHGRQRRGGIVSAQNWDRFSSAGGKDSREMSGGVRHGQGPAERSTRLGMEAQSVPQAGLGRRFNQRPIAGRKPPPDPTHPAGKVGNGTLGHTLTSTPLKRKLPAAAPFGRGWRKSQDTEPVRRSKKAGRRRAAVAGQVRTRQRVLASAGGFAQLPRAGVAASAHEHHAAWTAAVRAPCPPRRRHIQNGCGTPRRS